MCMYMYLCTECGRQKSRYACRRGRQEAKIEQAAGRGQKEEMAGNEKASLDS